MAASTGPVARRRTHWKAKAHSRPATPAWWSAVNQQPGSAREVRAHRSEDGGRSWTVAATPIRSDSASAGIFSLAFSDDLHGVAVGGDYSKPGESVHNIALTADGGRTWTEPSGTPPAGFRSAVLYLPKVSVWIDTGTGGSDTSSDGGRTWRTFDTGNFNALSFASRDAGWAVGPRGRIARIHWSVP